MGRLERQFDRYRRRGDAQALGHVFDRAAPELLELASHLTSDLALAEDLVQQTFLTAIERAATWDATRRLMPWLIGILTNQARASRRAAARAPDPERLASRGAPDPAATVASAELGRLVEDALARLPGRYREVVASHLDGARPVDIARDLERAPGTVRMQLQRGLTLLRRSLPPAALLTGTQLRGHAAVRATVLAEARRAVPALPATAPVAVALVPALIAPIGGVLMSKTVIVLCAGVLGVATTSWLLLRDDVAAEAPVAYATERETGEAELVLDDMAFSSQEDTAAPGRVAGASAPGVAPQAGADTGAAPGWYLVGHLLGVGDGQAASDASVHVFTFDVPDTPSAVDQVRADGSFEVDLTALFVEPGPATRELLVSVSHPGYASTFDRLVVSSDETLRAPSERTEIRRDYRLQPACGVRGVVHLPRGMSPGPVQLAMFTVDADGRPAYEPVRTAECEDDGSFEILVPEPGDFVLVAERQATLPVSRAVTVPAVTVLDLEPLDLEPGPVQIRGRVLLPGGETARCTVVARHERLVTDSDGLYWYELDWTGAGFRPLERRVKTEEDGTFALTGLARGRQLVQVEDVDGTTWTLLHSGTWIEAPAEGVVLDAGSCRWTVEVVGGGAPVDGATVSFRPLGAGGEGTYTTSTGPDGRAVLLADSTRDYEVTASRLGYADAVVTSPAAQRGTDLLTVLELGPRTLHPATLVLDLPTSAEVPLPRITATLEPLGPLGPTGAAGAELERVERTVTRSGSSFTVDELVPGRYAVEVEPNEKEWFGAYYGSYYVVGSFEVELAPGRTTHHPLRVGVGGRVRVHVEGWDGDAEDAHAAVEVLDGGGEAVDCRFVTVRYEDNVLRGGLVRGAIPLAEPCELYPNLASGTYQLVVTHDGWQFDATPFTIEPAATVELVVRARRE